MKFLITDMPVIIIIIFKSLVNEKEQISLKRKRTRETLRESQQRKKIPGYPLLPCRVSLYSLFTTNKLYGIFVVKQIRYLLTQKGGNK